MKLLARADARRIPLADRSVQCVVTSPPYWGLRDYGIPGQLGLEPTPEEYVANMVAVFREVRRVLRDDGTLWLNLGDSYATSPPGNKGTPDEMFASSGLAGARKGSRYMETLAQSVNQKRNTVVGNLKPKDLVGIPWRVAFALQADGWYLRSDIVWAKPNPMPESVTDRPTKAHEYVFLLSKEARYFYDAEAIREPHEDAQGLERFKTSGGSAHGFTPGTNQGFHGTGFIMKPGGRDYHPLGRNRRTVWTVATQPYSGAHFATFPEKLVEPCILAGTSARGCCSECGAPWERVVERTPMEIDRSERTHGMGRTRASGTMTKPPESTTTGWRPTCDHGHDPRPATVLDPFAGTATTVRVALRLGRRGVGLDLSAKYLGLAAERANHVQMEAPW